jgi:hypothetical protein
VFANAFLNTDRISCLAETEVCEQDMVFSLCFSAVNIRVLYPSSYYNALLFVAVPDLLDISISFTRNKPGKRNLSTHQVGDLPGDFNIESPNV